MSTERFLAIVYVLEARHLRTTKASIKAVSYVWILGLFLSIPAFFTPETGYMIDYADWKNVFEVDGQQIRAWDFKIFSENEIFSENNENSGKISQLLEIPEESIQQSELTMRFYPTFIETDLFGEKRLKRIAAHAKLKYTIISPQINKLNIY